MNTAYLSLGSNTPFHQRSHYLSSGREALSALAQTHIVTCSDIYETEAWGTPVCRPAFLNQIVCLRTACNASSLLSHIRHIEHSNGRVRHQLTQWEDRTLDIDILFFNCALIERPELSIPHPRMHQRKFILQILMNMGLGDLWHPRLRSSVAVLYAACKDSLNIRRYTAPVA